jgi:hypothetical protein
MYRRGRQSKRPGGMPRRRLQWKGKEPQCPLDLFAKGVEETLHSGRPSTSIYVSLLPLEVEGKKLVVEDCLEVLEALIHDVFHHLREEAYCCCLGVEDPAGKVSLSWDLGFESTTLQGSCQRGQETPRCIMGLDFVGMVLLAVGCWTLCVPICW